MGQGEFAHILVDHEDGDARVLDECVEGLINLRLRRPGVDDEEVGVALLVNVSTTREQEAGNRVVVANHGQ
eukprot:CAMPEP_0179910374 /NCGR_PEP_ID=MMETSP0982-20121206/45732_1 /TAXON_ID=483367 /ORGANISM="non described non described, Strain CCMP 2436" /LENGTH=70 /DNA_ID=CAMNT_0021811921 /DNA_START=1230 /DNA_END=1440 /DNA_ORIENTATION=-